MTVHAQDDVKPHILHILEGTFSLDVAYIVAIFGSFKKKLFT